MRTVFTVFVAKQLPLGKDKALFCEGACKRLMHCFCTSITEEQYDEFTVKKAKFV